MWSIVSKGVFLLEAFNSILIILLVITEYYISKVVKIYGDFFILMYRTCSLQVRKGSPQKKRQIVRT